MAEYPSVGLKIDLNEIVEAQAKLDGLRQSYLEVGRAAAAAEERAKGAAVAERAATSASSQNASARADGARRSAAAEEQANQNIMRGAREQLRLRMAMTRQRFGDETAVNSRLEAAESASVDRILALRIRMNRQRAQEARQAAGAEAAAAKVAADAQDARDRAAERSAEQVFQFRMRMTRQRAAMEAAEARANQPSDFGTFYSSRGSGGGSSAASMADTRRTLADVLGLRQAFDATTAAGAKFGNFLGGIRNSLGAVRSAFFDVRTAVAVFLGGLVVAPLVHMTDAMVALEARTKFYAERASDVPYTFEAIYRTAQAARAPLSAVATLYTRLAPMAERLGKSQLDILRTTETISKSFAIGGASPAESASSSQQLAQALASNRLGGDELRSLAENAPILVAKISQALGMNVGEFIKWAHAGKANAEAVIGAIDKAAKSIDEMFARFPVTIGQAMSVAGNAFQHLVGEVNKATGASTAVADLIMQFAGFLDSASTVDALVSSINGLIMVMSVLGDVTKAVGSYLPTLATGLLAIGAAKLLPTMFAAIARNMTEMRIEAVYSGRASSALGIAMTGATRAAQGMGAAVKGLVSFLGGPLGIALIAGAALFNYFSNAQKAAAASSKNLADSQDNALSALDRAVAFTDAYGVSNEGLKKSMDGVIAASKGATTEAAAGASANDTAMAAAERRAETERLLTVNILRRAAADALARGQEAQGAARALATKAFGSGVVTAMGTGDIRMGQQAEIEARKNLGVDRTYNDATAEFKLATDLYKQAGVISTAQLNLTKPAAGSGVVQPGSGDDKEDKAAKHRLERLVEETRQSRAMVNQIVAETAARRTLSDSIAGFYSNAALSGGAYIDMLRKQADAELQAKIAQETTKILADQKVTSLDQLTGTLRENTAALIAAKTAEEQAAEAQRRLNQALDQRDQLNESIGQTKAYTAALLGGRDALLAYERATRILEEAKKAGPAGDIGKITSQVDDAISSEAIQREAQRTYERAQQLRLAQESSAEAERMQRAMALSDEYMRIWPENGRAWADQMARAVVYLEQQAERMAALKREVKDSMERTFVETGKLDFKALKDGLGRAIRQAVWDNLLAKPINIVVNAAVNVVTKALEAMFSKAMGSIMGGGAGSAGGGAGNLFQSIAGLFGKSKGGYSDANRAGMDAAVDAATKGGTAAATAMAAKLSNVMSVLGTIGTSVSIGQTVTSMFGQKQTTGGLIGGTLGAGIGFALGGPIGAAIGATLGTAIGNLFKGGKESNYGAGGTRNGDSFTQFGDKRTAETSKLGEALGNALIAGEKALRDYGISTTVTATGYNIGTRDDTRVTLSNGQTLSSAVGDPSAAAEQALLQVLRSASYVDSAQKTFVESLLAAGKSFDDITVQLKSYAEAQALGKSIDREILKYTNPQSYALANLKDSQDARRAQVDAYKTSGMLSSAQVSAIYAQLVVLDQLELADTMKQFVDGVSGATRSLADFIDQQKRIADYANGLSAGSLSPLSPEAKLAYNQAQFEATLRAAQGGDYDALSRSTDDAQSYLEQAQQFFGSSAAYAAIFSNVQASLLALSQQQFADPMAQAMSAAATQIATAVDNSANKIADRVTETNGLLLDQLAKQTEAIVGAQTVVLTDLANAMIDTSTLDIARNGGVLN